MAGRTVVLGRGFVAFSTAVKLHLSGAELAAIVLVENEPGWETKLSEFVVDTPLEEVPLLQSHEELLGDYDTAWSVFYDRILPKSFLDRVRLPLNVHPAPLPRYRGVRPINWALKNGERTHGVTVHRMDEGIDSGPIYGQVSFPMWPDVDEVEDVYHRMTQFAVPLIHLVIDRLDAIVPYEQDHSQATINYSMYNHLLGDRADWTRALSLA